MLVRQRGPLFEAIIRALKDAGLPVAGADRLVLTEHIAVMDLMALADALLLPEDDLALACALKSPLFGLDEEQLFELAWDRKGSLTCELARKGGDNFASKRMRRWMRSRRSRARRRRSISSRMCSGLGRARAHSRAARAEAERCAGRVLELRAGLRARETPSLQGFLAWLRAAESDVRATWKWRATKCA